MDQSDVTRIAKRTARRSELERVADLVSNRTGLDFPESRRAITESAIRRAQKATGAPTVEAYLELLQSRERFFDDLVNELTVGETYFFRDPGQFEFIRSMVLPQLAARGGPARVWSAGCASGEEPFSIAILLDEMGLGTDGTVRGTDIAEPRLARARAGVFGEWSLRGCSPSMIDTYFRRVRNRYELIPRIRKAVDFSVLNLADPDFLARRPELKGQDIVLCRNVLIYLDRESVARVAESLLSALHPEGWLLLGASDPPLQDLVPCSVEITDAGLAYRRPRARRVSDAPSDARPFPPPTSAQSSPESLPGGTSTPAERPGRNRIDRKREGRRARAAYGGSAAAPGFRSAGFTDEAGCIGELRRLLNEPPQAAVEELFNQALRTHPESAEIAYLHAMLLDDRGRHGDAEKAARKALYLDRSLVVAHLALSRALERSGDRSGAERSLKNAASLLASLPPGVVVPASGGETPPDLLDLVRGRLRLLGREPG